MFGRRIANARSHWALIRLIAIGALAVALVAFPAGAMAAAGPGGGGGGGGGGHGGSGGGGGGGGAGETTGSLYSDLYVLLRAENGTPILKTYSVPAADPADPATTERCVQPVSYERVPGVTATTNPVDGRQVWIIPLQGQWLTTPPAGGLPAEFEACDPQPAYAMFVKEVDLERLNMTRTSDTVIASKTAAVATKLLGGTAIGLDAVGRIEIDGVPIDAAPEQAAIYQSLLKTGTIPGLPTSMAGPPAVVGPASSSGLNSQFDAWDLAAAAIGTTAAKETPITIDTVLYYNRILGFPAADLAFPAGWSVNFNRSVDPATGAQMTSGEQFVDFSGFSYNRSKTFPGSVTWLDVGTMTWKVSRVLDLVPFTNIPAAPVADRTLTGIEAFAQMADDVRAAILFLHGNEVIPGFFMDRAGTDTTAAQQRSITDPAVSWGQLPADVFQTQPFTVAPTLFNPWGGKSIDGARVRVTIHAPAPLGAGAVSATSNEQDVPFTSHDNGDMTGWWGPADGLSVKPGDKLTIPLTLTIGAGAPIGAYTVTLDLVSADNRVLATDKGNLTVHGNVQTALWGAALPKLVTQGVVVKLPIKVYAPAAANAELQFSIAGPGDDPSTPDVVEALKAGDVSVYGEAPAASGATDMVAMPLTLVDGRLVGNWPVALAAGYTDVVWYMTIAVGAPEGGYHVEAGLAGDPNVIEADLSVGAPESHGQQPPGAGEQTPTVVLATDGTLGTSATFLLSTETAATDVTFQCQLTVNGQPGLWTACTTADGGRASYQGLLPGTYTFAAFAMDAEGDTSGIVRMSWTVTANAAQASGGAPSPSGAPVTTQQQQKQQQKTRARVTLSLWWLPGERLHLWGSVYPAHTGKQVTIQERTRTGWKTVGKVRLQRADQQRSQFTITLAHATPGVYRAYMAADTLHLASDSPVMKARARSSVTLQLQQLTRDRVRLSGAVLPARNGQKVMIQQRTRTGWKTVATVALRQGTEQRSRYVITLAHPNPGVYRAHYGGDSGYRPGDSTLATVR
jgi:hypothetical protein